MSSADVVDRVGRSASAHIAVEEIGGRQRFRSLRSDPPLTFRITGSTLTWVGTTAGPIGGDRTRLDIEVLEGARLSVRSVGASIALPGPHGLSSHATVDVSVGDGATFHWCCEPVIVATDADHIAETVLRVGARTDVVWVDEVVLGRHGERAGRLRSTLRVDGADGAILRTGLDLGGPAWNGPAVVGDASAVVQVFALGVPAARLLGATWSEHPDVRHAVSPGLAGSAVWTAVSTSSVALRAAVRDAVAVAR